MDDDTASEAESTEPKPSPVFGEITRKEWGAIDSRAKNELWIPVTKVLLVYGTQTKPCTTPKECIKSCRDIQVRDMFSKRMPDINYNFLIGGDENVYEGRGFGLKVTLRSDYVPNSLVIAFIGDYAEEDPPERTLAITDEFIKRYVKEGKISPNWKKHYIRGYE